MSKYSSKNELRLEHWLSILLRGGVNTALLLLIFGFIINFWTHQSWIPLTDLNALLSGAGNLHSEPPKNLAEFIYGMTSLQSIGFVQCAILILILLPALRVAFLWGGFLKQRDWIFSAFAFLVLVIMSLGVFFRIAEHS